MTTTNAIHATEQHVAFEILGMCPKLRDDIRVSVQVYAGEACYVLEDVLGSKFYRVGIAEYTFVSLLDGRTTIAEAMGQTAVICGSDALDEREVASLCKWLVDSSLAVTQQSIDAARISEDQTKQQSLKLVGTLNPMIQKIPLFNPMAALKTLDPIANVCFSLLGLLIGTMVVTLGGYKAFVSWDQLVENGGQIFANHNWLWLFITWAGLKLIHELSHAMACRRFNGNVREAGIVFILFAPMPYVDVTSSWRMDNKWKRILIAAAGMYAEIFCAAVAAIIWCGTFDPLVRQHAMNVMITATLVTLLFNANPLMRFDGYYMLTDLVEMPNLGTHGRQWISYAMRRYVMGLSVQCPVWPEGRPWVVRSYAVAALIWRVLISVSLIVSAEVLLHGAGKILAVAAALVWIGIPIYKAVRAIVDNKTANRRRMTCIATTFALVAWMCWSIVPWYSTLTAALIVDYHPPQEIRVPVSGFLQKQNVSVGDQVTKGQILATLTNRELEIECQNLLLQWEQSRIRERNLRNSDSIAAVQVEQKTQAALRSRITQTQEQLAGLVVIAPADGIIATSDMQSREGTVVRQGDRLFVLGNKDHEKMVGLVEQADVEAFRDSEGQQLTIHLWGTGTKRMTGEIARVLPRASVSLPHPALSAMVGGPLSVRSAAQNANSEDAMQLVEPRFSMLIDFQGDDQEKVSAGQTGYALLNYRSGTVGQAFWESLQHWIEKKRAMVQAYSRAT